MSPSSLHGKKRQRQPLEPLHSSPEEENSPENYRFNKRARLETAEDEEQDVFRFRARSDPSLAHKTFYNRQTTPSPPNEEGSLPGNADSDASTELDSPIVPQNSPQRFTDSARRKSPLRVSTSNRAHHLADENPLRSVHENSFQNAAGFSVYEDEQSDENVDPTRPASLAPKDQPAEIQDFSAVIIKLNLVADNLGRAAAHLGELVHSLGRHSTGVREVTGKSGLALKKIAINNTTPSGYPYDAACGYPSQKSPSIEPNDEEDGMFTGLVFYFIPNNDAGSFRRRHIHAALDHGADWAKSWTDTVSHVIVEPPTTLGQVLGFLRISELPRNLVLVNMLYIHDCIGAGRLLNPTVSAYLVPGNQPHELLISPPSKFKRGDSQSRLKSADFAASVGEYPQIEAPVFKVENNKITVRHFSPSDERLSDPFINAPSNAACEREGSGQSNDGLSKAIGFVKETRELPIALDSEDDDDLSTSESEAEEDSPQVASSSSAPWSKGNFLCLQDPKSTKESPNQYIVDVLEKLLKHYEYANDHWRAISYRKAIATLRRAELPILTAEQAKSLPNIGASIAKKIEEIVRTRKLDCLSAIDSDPVNAAQRTFLGIYGVGPKLAAKWIHQGHRTLDDILQSQADLTENQRIGIEHHHDFNLRIPREEVTRLGGIVKTALHAIDPAFEVTICGSYRRGALDSGDIDLMITLPGADMSRMQAIVFNTLLPRLTNRGFVTASFTKGNATGSKWHGACQLPVSTTPVDRTLRRLDSDASVVDKGKSPANANPWRRIDLLLVPDAEAGAALLYFTGNDLFNRSMRLLARKKGMRLSQHGLFWRTGPRAGELIEARDEQRIFAALGVPWREPAERQV